MNMNIGMKRILLAIILILTLAGCTDIPRADSIFCSEAMAQCLPGIPEASEQQVPASNDTITIASFNIQVFGKTKAGKPEVMTILADTIRQFDIVAIQEIRDKSGTAIEALEAAVDALGTYYEYIIGPRLGRTQSKEQYAYMFNAQTVEPAGTAFTADDPLDIFHREPFIAMFASKNSGFDFTLATIHIDPDTAHTEIAALHEAITSAIQKTGEPDVIVLGDYNADCRYWNENDQSIPLRSDEYTWLIDNNADTNVAPSDCTYDRIVITTNTATEDWTGDSGIYCFDEIHNLTYDQAKAVSDHYPVWATFYIANDTD